MKTHPTKIFFSLKYRNLFKVKESQLKRTYNNASVLTLTYLTPALNLLLYLVNKSLNES